MSTIVLDKPPVKKHRKISIYDLSWDDIDTLEEVKSAFEVALDLAEKWNLEVSRDELSDLEDHIDRVGEADYASLRGVEDEVNRADGLPVRGHYWMLMEGWRDE
ncbi:hypothetical protein FACS1894184_19350 [Clostridia bacterium]|nr:hypothetical protein FACS1894184_19350 [Clostridia bacterium]